MAKEPGSFDQLRQFIKDYSVLQFFQIDRFINQFNWGFFMVDNDPAHPEAHPVDQHLLNLQAQGQIEIDMQGRRIINKG